MVARWRVPLALGLGLTLACTETPSAPTNPKLEPELLTASLTAAAYTDRAALLAAAPTLAYTTIDFATLDDGSPITGDQFYATLPLGGATFNNVRTYYGQYLYWSRATRVDLPPNTYTIGIDLFTFQGSGRPPGTWTMTLSTGATATAPFGARFLGYVSPSPIQWVQYSYDTDIPLMDNLVYGVESDSDGDGVEDAIDNCPEVASADQADTDADGQGDACESDDDADEVTDGIDNCPVVANTGQEDFDGDTQGDACDLDDDEDGVNDINDNCPLAGNSDQSDADTDGIGDPCDPDDDGDGVNDDGDNCPLVSNPNQADADSDGVGDLCDPTPNPLPTYNFTGFFPPVDQPTVAVNKAKAGSAIPVKFKLGSDQGLAIFKDGFPAPVPYPCEANATTDPIENTVSASLSSLSYDATSGQYTYTWKTDKAWAGKCLQLHLGLKDGSDEYAKFQFTK